VKRAIDGALVLLILAITWYDAGWLAVAGVLGGAFIGMLLLPGEDG
jgi:hypothetical protein